MLGFRLNQIESFDEGVVLEAIQLCDDLANVFEKPPIDFGEFKNVFDRPSALEREP